MPARIPGTRDRIRPRRPIGQTIAADLGIYEVTLHYWRRLVDVDNGRRPGNSSSEDAELRAARGWIRQLEQEVNIVKLASRWLAKAEHFAPKGAPGDRPSRRHRGTCRDLRRLLGVSQQGLLPISERPTSATKPGRLRLSGLIREIHTASRGTYGYRRIHDELTIGMEIPCSSRLISVLMRKGAMYGLPGPTRMKRLKGVATAHDLVHREFHRLTPNEL